MRTKEQNAQDKGKDDKKKETKPDKRFSRRDALRAGLAVLGGAALSRCSSEYKAKPNDGGTSDASDLDATTSLDASMMDSGMTPDASLLDGSVHLDSALQNDASTGNSCVATQVETEPHLMSNTVNNSFTVGEYRVTWTGTTGNTESTTIDISCTADNVAVATDLTLQKGTSVDVPLDAAMKLTLSFISGGAGWVLIEAGISQI